MEDGSVARRVETYLSTSSESLLEVHSGVQVGSGWGNEGGGMSDE